MTRLRALVADDNALTLRFFADAFATLGVECVTAADGVEAAEHAQSSRFDVLLVDARMPRLDGIGALRRIRASNAASRGALAWATTAADDTDAHAQLRAAGFADVIVKPATIERLRSLLARAFGNFLSANCPMDAPTAPLADAAALAVAGGDATIVAALRSLFASELDALPAEVARMATVLDSDGLRERLHRLDASAGFCGAPTIAFAAAQVRAALSRDTWPHTAVEALLVECERVRVALQAYAAVSRVSPEAM